MDREAGIEPAVKRVDILGLHVSAVDLDSATRQVAAWIDQRQSEYVCVTGVHGVMESQRDPELLRIHNAAGMVTPDGMPLVWCSRLAGSTEVKRVYGPDLMLRVCAQSVSKGWRHFFYGAAPGVAEQLAANLQREFPGLEVVGTHSPPYRELTADELHDIANLINSSGADIVWIGLSTPKQERWMSRLRSLLEPPVLIGVGAAFDIHAGNLRQAPRWMQRSGLEWLFRLLMEPRRLWKRYLKSNPAFVWRIAANRPRLLPEEMHEAR